MLRSRDGVLVLQTLLWPDEVREARFDFLDQDVTVRPQELAMAESYISALSADFDPSEYSDHYREALESVIEAKAAGREMKAPAEKRRTPGRSWTSWRRCAAASPRQRRGAARRRRQDAPAEGKSKQPGIHQENSRQEGREDRRRGEEGDEDDQSRKEDHGEEGSCAAQRLTESPQRRDTCTGLGYQLGQRPTISAINDRARPRSTASLPSA